MLRPLSRLSLRAKMLATFALMFGVLRIDALVSAPAEIRDENLPAVRALGSFAYNTMRFRHLEATILLADDADERSSEQDRLGQVHAAVDRSIRDFEAASGEGMGRHLLGEIAQGWAGYLDGDAKFQVFVRGHDDAAAVRYYRGELRTLSGTVQQALNAALSTSGADPGAASDRRGAPGRSARVGSLVVAGLAFVLCLAGGPFVVRRASSPLARVRAATRRLFRRPASSARADAIVRALSRRARRIGRATRLVTRRTRLRALKAGLDAARAGEAKMAAEVESLTRQTARATEEVAGQVARIQAATEAIGGMARGPGETSAVAQPRTTRAA